GAEVPYIHVMKGTLVKVIADKNKGAKARIIATLPSVDRVVVEGVNMITKHSNETDQGARGAKSGGVQTMEAPIHVSNVKTVKDDSPKGKAADKPADKKAEKADETGEDS